jgi:hypothetical protein
MVGFGTRPYAIAEIGRFQMIERASPKPPEESFRIHFRDIQSSGNLEQEMHLVWGKLNCSIEITAERKQE